MSVKSFRNWTRQNISDEFGLKVKRKCEHLEEWLNLESPIEKEEKEQLLKLQKKLIDYVDIWNEQELIIKFISFLIGMVDYDTENYKAFANRKLKATINKKTVSGEVDLMVASGEFEPKKPYFCLHEYKKEKGTDNDPLGQLLIAMLAAQELNQNNQPVYGAYVFGRNWFFVTLINNAYCISNEFVATRDDLFDIVKIMKNLKILIDKMKN